MSLCCGTDRVARSHQQMFPLHLFFKEIVDDFIKSSILKSDMKKPYISIDIEIVTGMKLTPKIHKVQEEGEVVGYDGEKEEIYMTDGKEGWTISKEFEGSLGDIYFK